ncbi:DEAD/DEAH box helicase [Marinobacter mangrovi]|uniref:DEAD/DEAH box helicase n=1 Tax=Marinobacter mangrovi TaxID=2803918 RepID=UPI001931CA96|nr:ATP-binding domain-containing protein [Marinobacter mangrovi]
MSNSFFFFKATKNQQNEQFVNEVAAYSEQTKTQMYLVDGPLVDNKYKYSFKDALILLVPKHKITFINFSDNEEDFEDYVEDVLEDLSAISDKFRYKQVVGRSRHWKSKLTDEFRFDNFETSIEELLDLTRIELEKDQKKCELLISLLTGSINDIERVGEDVPDNILDRVKSKIQLFDGDQTRFVYQAMEKPVIRIQGLSGTGKTELLLHKLRDIYVNYPESKVIFTCHNKILSHNLRQRIPEFFNFMKVEEQIKWNERLWCVNAWGSQSDLHSGAYRYITAKYQLPFNRYSRAMSFDKACTLALSQITDEDIDKYGYAFDFMLIDESQDFGQPFIDLCERVTKNTVFVAGDIFQSIFDQNIVSDINPDFLLSKCYRTDPRTLMFAHGLGMGLFEQRKLRWLAEPEWKACGYILDESDDNHLELSREPLRRFEDIEKQNIKSLELFTAPEPFTVNSENQIIDVIAKIREENRTVLAEDIGIIFVDDGNITYEMADVLENSVQENFDWDVNKAYESKVKSQNSVFISNRNNVKGLEFPFVIVVAKHLRHSHSYRNALYMMLTRSFIKTYFVISEEWNQEIIPSLKESIEHINDHGSMVVEIPSADEIKSIRTTIKFDENSQSFYDFVEKLLNDLNVPPIFRQEVFDATQAVLKESFDKEQVEETINFVLKQRGI